MGQELEGEALGPEFAGYKFRIAGGNDKQGFPMVQGVLVNTRVRILLTKGSAYYRPRRTGERKRKSVRGCVVGPDLSVIHLNLVKKGDKEIPGLTDDVKPARLGPKRANYVRKYFDLAEDADPTEAVVRREVTRKSGGKDIKKPKVQRLVTPRTLHHKRQLAAKRLASVVKSAKQKAEYTKLLERLATERRASAAARKSSRKASRAPAGSN